MSSAVQEWVELDPIYLTDFKTRPIEVMFFFNRCRYNPALKTPVLRRSPGFQTVTVDRKAEIEGVVVEFVTRPDVRLLANGLSASDWKRLPRIVRNPAANIINGTAAIYEVTTHV